MSLKIKVELTASPALLAALQAIAGITPVEVKKDQAEKVVVTQKDDAESGDTVKQETADAAKTAPSRTRTRPAAGAAKQVTEKPEEKKAITGAQAIEEEEQGEESQEEKTYTVEEVRGIAKGIMEDKTKLVKVKALLESFDAASITALDPKHYSAFVVALKKL